VHGKEPELSIDLSAITAGDPNVPVVNCDPEAFFRSTYLTADLHKPFDEVLTSLAGERDFSLFINFTR
jgi:hypothetical protein